MTLAHARIGQVVTVARVGGDRGFRRRLMELGLVPGTRVELAGIAPIGDPLKLVVRGCFLSIRRNEAASVEIQHVVERASVRPAPQPAPVEAPSLAPASASAFRATP